MRSIILVALVSSAYGIPAIAQEPTQTLPAPTSVQSVVAPPFNRPTTTSPAPAPVEDVKCLSESQQAEYARRRSELFKSAFSSNATPAAPPSHANGAACVQASQGNFHDVGACMTDAAIDAKMPGSPAGQAAKTVMRNVIAQMKEYHIGMQKLRAEYPSCPPPAK